MTSDNQTSLTTSNNSGLTVLKKTKSLVSITDKLLAKSADDHWVQKLFDWADEFSIDDLHWEGDSETGFWRGLPRDKEKLTHIDELILSDYNLTYIPKEIARLANLEFLDCSRNKIAVLPSEVGMLINLEIFAIPMNQLSAVPKEIGLLTKLEFLDMSFNPIASLPEEVGRLVNLEVLNLEYNKMVELPNEIVNLAKLEMLNIIRRTSDNFIDETKKLFIQTGKLDQLNEGWIKSFKDAHSIHFTNSQLQWITELEDSGCIVKLDQTTTAIDNE
jgi:Leucine-rich repeat (LRR) protein